MDVQNRAAMDLTPRGLLYQSAQLIFNHDQWQDWRKPHGAESREV